jgi:hypothetical protein
MVGHQCHPESVQSWTEVRQADCPVFQNEVLRLDKVRVGDRRCGRANERSARKPKKAASRHLPLPFNSDALT